MVTRYECCMQFGRNSGISTLQNSNNTVIYVTSQKPSKKDEQDLLVTAGGNINESKNDVF